MSTPSPTRPAPPAAAQPPRAVASRSRADRASQALTGRGSGATPRRLRLARLAHVAIALVLGVGAVVTGVELSEREQIATVHAEQYERATAIEAGLQEAQAGASATPAAPAALPEATRTALDEVSTLLVDVAAQRTDDPADLAEISRLVSRYTESLAAGKSAPAKELLTEELLPAVQRLQEAHNAVSSAVVTWWMWLVPVGAWLAVAFIVGIAWYAARISHRVINPGLAIAAVATVTLAVGSGSFLAAHQAGTAANPGFLALAVGCAAISTVAGAWGLHQRLKEYR